MEIKLLRPALTAVAVVVLALLIAAVTFLAQTRSDYYAKVSVDLAARYSEQVIEVHLARYKSLPPSLSALSMPAGDPGFVPKLALDVSTGALSVLVENDYGNYGSLRYVPTRDTNGRFGWRCLNVSVASSLLPPSCSQ